MPQINLLSPGVGLRKKKRSITADPPLEELKRICKILIMTAGVTCVVCFVIWLVLSSRVKAKKAELAKAQKKVDALELNPDEIKNLESQRGGLNKKVELIDRLSSRDFYYYRKLELIAQIIPEGVWLIEVNFQSTDISPRARQNTRRRRSQVEPSGTVSSATRLILKGKAVSGRIGDAVGLIQKFYENLKANEEFSDDFTEIKIGDTSLSRVGSREVMIFDVICSSE